MKVVQAGFPSLHEPQKPPRLPLHNPTHPPTHPTSNFFPRFLTYPRAH